MTFDGSDDTHRFIEIRSSDKFAESDRSRSRLRTINTAWHYLSRRFSVLFIFAPRNTMLSTLSIWASLMLLLEPIHRAYGFLGIHQDASTRSASKHVHHKNIHWRHSVLQQQESSEQNSRLTDWVIENLETSEEGITSSSNIQAGENDTLPLAGLCIGKVRILAAESTHDAETDGTDLQPIRLLMGRNGWGTGVHPTTRLCVEWICDSSVIQGGEVVLDYGCGSGVLSIAALHMGASRIIGVDIEAEALVTAERNLQLNGYGEERFEGLHTREVQPYDLCRPAGVDVCVANILIGQLVRPSMVAAILSNLAPGGLLCLSGIRPNEVDALKAAYGDAMEWQEDQYAELSASECEGSLESYGFDTGRWARVVGKYIGGDNRDSDIQSMSELAIS